MAGLLLAGVGAALGGFIGGGFLGISAVVIGQSIGAVVGSVIDNYLFAPSLKFTQEGPRLQETQIFTSTEGQPIIRGYGRFRIPGNMIWATRLREEVVKETTKQGGKGGGGTTITTTTYNYYANFAVGLCEGEIQNIHRVWADGKRVDLSELTYRVYTGTEAQTADSLITTKEGTGNVPAYRGLAYIVFEDMHINKFGNRIPQMSFEITKPVSRSDADAVGDLITGVDLIPGTTEFGYDPTVIDQVIFGGESGNDIVERRVENNHDISTTSDWELALDQLELNLPNCNIVTLVVTWFGDDLRIGHCTIKPKVESTTKNTDPISWTVAGLVRSTADVMSQYEGGAAFGGSPNDLSVYRAIVDLKARGFEVMFYPFIIMDIDATNTLPNPYSDNAASTGQAVYPWRGRITCSPAIGYVGTVDQTATAKTQIDTFLGTADASEFSGSAGAVTYSGTVEWSFNRFILHMAELCRQAGGVEYFCIGTEMVGATKVRDNLNDFPFVDGLVSLAAEVTTLLPSAKIGYAADWSEYHSYRPDDGTGDVFFNMDKLWSDASVDFIGIDNYLPISDWRNGDDHADYGDGNDTYGNAKGESVYDLDYLKGQIEGGEYYDYYYLSPSDRADQVRTAISDGSYSKPWVFRNKDIKGWWQTTHYDRVGGVERTTNILNKPPSGWSYTGVIYSAPNAIQDTSTGSHYMVTLALSLSPGVTYRQWFTVKAVGSQTKVAVRMGGTTYPAESRTEFDLINLTSVSTLGAPDDHGIVDLGGGYYNIWIDYTTISAGNNNGVLYLVNDDGNLSYTGDGVSGIEILDAQYGVLDATNLIPESKPIIFTEYGCPALNKGTNQPNVFFDPKSSESSLPYFSSGGRDDEIQRQYIRALKEYWDPANGNNPTSSVYSASMIDTTRMCYWSYDARPWPTFPTDGDSWADQSNWQYGHWISGRIDTVFVPDLLRALAEDYELTAPHDFSRAYGSCDGFVIQSKTSFRSTVEPLATVFMFNIIESGDQFKAVSEQEMRSLATLTDEDITQAHDTGGEMIMLTRRQETELPAEISIRYVDIFASYEPASVGQSREVVEASGAPVTDTPIVIDMARAQQLVDRLLYSAWAKRTSGEFGAFPEFLYLEAGDVITIKANGFNRPLRIDSIADGPYRRVNAGSFDTGIFEAAGAAGRTQPINTQPVSSAVVIALMDLPQLRSTDNGWQPYAAAYVNPWPAVNLYKSITSSNYSLDTTLPSPTVIGETTDVFGSGVTDIWDNANELKVQIYSDSLSTLDEESVLNSGNTLAIENSSGGWELVQFVTATATGSGTYTLTKLLRGQLGTEDNMEVSLAAGARIVLVESTLRQIQLGISDIGREYYFKYGPADKGMGDPTHVTEQRTFNGRGLKPFSPVHISAVASGGDSIISWIRRTRINGDNWEYLDDVPLSEATEKYEVDVLNGSSVVVRTLSVTNATTVTYTSAQKSADSISAPFDVIIYQLSDLVGRGIGRRATITV